MSRAEGIIVFKDVTYEYNVTRPILKDASFVVRRGSKLTLMGQNGAGKSTIFSLISRASFRIPSLSLLVSANNASF